MELSRDMYQKKIEAYLGVPLIKIITGQRRVGKTVIMHQIAQKFPLEEVFFLSKEDSQFEHIVTHSDFSELLKQEQINKKKYFFIDEVQMIEGWEKSIISLFSQEKNIEIFLSGSNASLLSSELSTLLAGRYIEFHIHPFSYAEFCEYFGYEKNSDSFLSYLEVGGFPTVYQMQNNAPLQKEWIQTLINTIFLKDIAARYVIRDVSLLEDLFLFFANNAGNLSSLSRMITLLAGKKIVTNLNTLNSYIGYLKNTFLLYECPLYDIEGKRIFDRERKFYISDHSIRNALFSGFDEGRGKHLENIVFLELMRRGYSVYVGRIKKKEVDFVAEKNGEKLYVQVAYLLADASVVEREFSPLQSISDNWKKVVVSLDPVSLGIKEGIVHVRFWELEKIFD